MRNLSFLLLTLTTVVALTACFSSETRRQASGSFEYLEKNAANTLKVPENLDQPLINPRYDIPDFGDEQTASVVGTQLDIASPRLVIPLVQGSYVEEGDKEAKVFFDQINDANPLDQTIWNKVIAYLDSMQIGVSSFDKANNELVTDWVIDRQETDSSWYDLTDNYIESTMKYKLTLDMAPHGRTASLTSEMIEFVDASGNAALAQRAPTERRNDEVDFLNSIIAEYDFGLRLEVSERIAKIRQGFTSDMDVNAQGEPAFIVNAIYADAWPRIQLVLTEMGFVVVDLDQSAGLIFANYVGQTSWFSKLLGSNDLDLDEGEYRMLVEPKDGNTAVTFKEIDDSAFSDDKVVSIFPVFSKMMADDSLEF
ncbi:MAG: outer membrane protein assembly factor BamC [Pseudomonadota bacterium]